MDLATLLPMACAVFGAALLQSATGIGYGVIAGPVFLVVLNGVEAFQMSALHTLLISAALAPALLRDVKVPLLILIIAGAAIGLPLGFALQMAAEIAWLKAAALVMVAFVAASLLRDMRRSARGVARRAHSRAEAGGVGLVSGMLGGMLAMPGPVPATWMSITGYSKRDIRATILAFFIFVFGSNALLFAATTGFTDGILWTTLVLTAPLLAGIWAGHALSRHLSELLFRRILLAILCCTVLLLAVDLLRA